jgi:hypothetical protein
MEIKKMRIARIFFGAITGAFCLIIVLAILHETELILQSGNMVVPVLSFNSILVQFAKISPWLFLGFCLAKSNTASNIGRPLLFLVLSYSALVIAEFYAGLDYSVDVREIISGKSYTAVLIAMITRLGMLIAVIWAYAIALLILAGKMTAAAKKDGALGLTRAFLILAGLSLLTIAGAPLFYIFEALAYGSLSIYFFSSGYKPTQDQHIHIINDLPR